MKKFYTNSILFVSTLVFSKMKDFRSFFVFGNSSKKIFFAFLLLFFSFSGSAQTVGFGPNCSTLCYGPGGPFNINGSLTISSDAFYSSITIKSGYTLTVLPGATLYVGQVNTPATTQVVDFQNGSIVVIQAGASLVVNGKLNNSNNSDSVTFNGSVSVTGDVTVGNGSTITGSGSLIATGAVSGPGTVFSVTGDCYQVKSPPTGFSNQSFCSGATVASLVATGSNIKWYATSSGGSALSTSLSLVNANRYYAAQTNSNGCVSEARLAVTVSITPTVGTPTAITISSGTEPSCQLTNVTTTTTYATTSSNNTGLNWTLSNAAAGTISAAGVMTWNNGFSGLVNIQVTGSGCNGPSSQVIRTVTVNALPDNVLEGFTGGTICTGSAGILTFDADNTGFAGPYKIVYKIKNGTTSWTADISDASPTPFNVAVNPIITTDYVLISITNAVGCVRTALFGNATARITVNASLSAVTVTAGGNQTICATATGSLLTAAETGGGIITSRQWGKRSVAGGTITAISGQTASTHTPTGAGLTAGTWFIVCTSTPTCGTPTISNEVTVTVSAPIAQTLSETNTVCIGSTTTFSSTTSGGTWTSATPAVATVNSSTGVVTGVTAGTSIINYSVTTAGGCVNTASQTVTVSAPIVQTVTGTNTVCVGNTTTFSSTTSGGTWTSATPAVATVDSATGVVTGVSAGTSIINYSVTTAGGCVNTASQTVTVSAPIVLTVTGTNTVCVGNTTTFSSTTSGGTWTSATPAVATVDSATGVVTRVAAGTSAINYSVTTTAGCVDTGSRIVTVNSIPARPEIVVTSQPNCTAAFGTFKIAKYISSYTYNISPSLGVTISGDLVTAPAATYTISATSLGCTSPPSADVEIIAAMTNTWNGTEWSIGISGTPPNSSQAIEFASDYNSTTNLPDPKILDGCSCIVNAGVSVTFNEGHTLRIQNQVTVLGTGTGAGTLTFENNASLVQVNNPTTDPATATQNKGNIIYQRITPPILDTDYVYWSSPVTVAILGAIQKGTLYYSFNAAGNSWVKAYSTTTMANGIGYIVRGAGTGLASGQRLARTATFRGVPNNGINDVKITAGKSNLIGNPYPSAIDPDAFLNANMAALEGTLYFWTHKSAIQLAGSITVGTAGSGAYAYSSGDYAAYTLTGGVGTSLTGGVASSKIAAGQSFLAIGSSQGGTARFTNSMRLTKGGEILDNSQFLRPASASKTSKVTTTNEIVKSRIWLNLSNTQAAFKQTLIGYVNGATNHYDRGFDAVSINGNAYVDFYSINNDSLLTIQGRALPIPEADTVPLGFSSAIEGDFTISIDKTDGLLTAMDVFLEDKLVKTFINLKTSTYTFTTEKGTFNDRFVMRYANKTLEVTDFETTLENQVVVSNKSKQLIITSTADTIDKVVIFDTTARKVYEKINVDSQELRILDLMSSRQILLVKVVLQNGKSITKKLFY